MKKIPTMFERDWAGDKSRVVDKAHKDCGWVFAGEGLATRKIDGTSCMVRDGVLLKRREVRRGDGLPENFEVSTEDEETGKAIGWVPVGEGPEDRWHREAFATAGACGLRNGTYELVGPKVQGNPEGFSEHVLVSHEMTGDYADVPRTFEGLREWLSGRDIEGLVFHHADGRMAKIKQRDFGMKRG